MSVMTSETREKRLQWLTRPIDWAYMVAMGTGGTCAWGWYNGDILLKDLLLLAVTALFISGGLSFWALQRINRTANRR